MRTIILAAMVAAAVAGAAVAEDAPRPTPAETPNGALALELPAGWTAKALKSGLSLEAPGGSLDETIVAACEPFAGVTAALDDPKLEELLARLRAGQLATLSLPGAQRATAKVGAGAAAVVTYRGTDDGGKPAALRIAVLPADGRVAILSARLPLERLEARARDLDAILASFAVAPADAEKALAKRLVGTWRSAAAPAVALRFAANGTFEEVREGGSGAGTGTSAGRPSHGRGGTFDVIGREVRLRFDDGWPRAFRVDAEPAAGTFVSSGQTWTRIPE